MAYEQRAPINYLTGTLSTAAAISDTSLSAAIFAALPNDYSSTKYLPLVIHDPTAGNYEVVWVTAHTTSSTSVTVVRARESTTARAWPSGSYIMCAPTIRDALSASTLAGLPSDAHTGMRAVVTDKNYTAERLHSGGWGPSCGVALADDVGPQPGGSNPPSSANIVLRAGHVSGLTNGSGEVTVTYRVPFPTATIAVMITPRATSVPIYSNDNQTASGFIARVWKVTSLAPFVTAAMDPSYSAVFHYLAIGY